MAKSHILSHWSKVQDTASGPYPDTVFKWNWPRFIVPKIPLNKQQALLAQTYVNAIIRLDYPYQARELMGRHIWLEFCEYWARNPDFDKAIRYL